MATAIQSTSALKLRLGGTRMRSLALNTMKAIGGKVKKYRVRMGFLLFSFKRIGQFCRKGGL